MGFIKKGNSTNAGKVSPPKLESLKSEFIKSAVAEFGVLPQLAFNVDETPINLVPASN